MSLRAVIIGLILCVVIGMGEPYAILGVRGSWLAADYSTGAAIFLFFLLCKLSLYFAGGFSYLGMGKNG